MKKIVLFAALYLAAAITVKAQAPQALNYQGVARNVSGSPLAATPIGLQLIIHDGSAGGTIIYQETQTPTTNSFGIYTVQIGTGNVVSGTFNGINWGSGNKFLEVGIDPAGGTSFTSAGTSQLVSVPYAVYANNAGNALTATSAGTLSGTVPMSGDVTGTNTAANVVKLQGNSISSASPAAGQRLTWDAGTSSWTPQTDMGTVDTIIAGTGLSGGIITSSGTISMPDVGTAGTYGSATQVPVITTDAQGRVSGVTNTTIAGDNWGTQSVVTDATLAGNGLTATPLKIAQHGATTGQALEWNGTTWLPATIPAPVTYAAGTGLLLAGTTFSAQSTTAMWNANELQGNTISTTTPTAGQGLIWSGTSWAPASLPSYTAGTGLSLAGSVFSAQNTAALWNANQLQGNAVSATAPAAGQGLVWSGTSWSPAALTPAYTAGTGLSLAGTTFNAQNATALWNANELQGNAISTTAPASGQGLVWTGSAWAPGTLSGTVISAGTGINIASGVVSAQTTTALWNANELQGKNISATAPTSGQELTWNSGTSSWTPTNPSGGTVTTINTTAGQLTGGPITTTGTLGLATTSVTAGTYGSGTQVPSIAVDAYGRITSASNTTIAGTTPGGAAGGDLTGTYPNPALVATGVTTGSYGTTTQVPTITVDAKGRITSASNTTISGVAPGGAAGGDLTGTYPNPAVATGAITNAKVAPAAGIVYSKLNLTGSIAIADHSATGAPSATTFLRGDNTWNTPTGITPGGTAGGDLAGTYPNPTVSTGAITNAKVAPAAAIAYSKLNLTGSIAIADHSATGVPSAATFLRGDNTWSTPAGGAPSGPAGGDLSGTYPNPALTTSGVTAGSYGNATNIPTVVVDAKGRVTSASNNAVTIPVVSGTTNYISKFTSPTAIGNSEVFDNGTAVGIGTTTPSATDKLEVINSSTATNYKAIHGVSGGVSTGSITVASGVYGESNTGIGISGVGQANDGIFGYTTSATNAGVEGYNSTAGGAGVLGSVSASGGVAGYFDGGTSGGIGVGVYEGKSGFETLTPRATIEAKSTADTMAGWFSTSTSAPATSHGIVEVDYSGTTDNATAFIANANNVSTNNGTVGVGAYGTGVGLDAQGSSSLVSGTASSRGLDGSGYSNDQYALGVGAYGNKNGTGAAPATCYGIVGNATGGTTNYGAYFFGDVHLTGTLTGGTKAFKIDHPLDPANKYLYHSCIESDEMVNIYSGNVTTDATGTAVVNMPDYFEALNKDFRYQLTVIGTFAQAIISKEVSGNSFEIKSSQPNVKVSWQVTGVRHDAYANAHRIVPEVEKESYNKGRYLDPADYGKPENQMIGYEVSKPAKAKISHTTVEANKSQQPSVNHIVTHQGVDKN